MRKKWWCFVLVFFSHVQHMPPPLPSKTPPPPPPKTTRKQASVDSGIVQWVETPAVGTNKQRPRHQVIRHHLVSNMLSVHSSRLLAGWRDGYLTLSAREQEVNSHLLPLRDFAFRWISLDQQLSDFHFKGESLAFFPHYVQRIVYMILFYFRFFVCGLIMTSFVLTYQRHYIRSG